MTKINPEINIFSDNIYENFSFKFNEKKALDMAKSILKYYLDTSKIFEKSCLWNQKFNCLSFDILYCNNEKTHEINKEYRQKDYPADIITFAIFADSEDKFIFDGEINLGEMIISLDKIDENAKEKNISFEDELHFLIAHGIMHLLGFDHQTDEDYKFIIEAQTDALKSIVDGR